jgi:glycosyltransferase involved in cell wall biosynthesis
VTNDATLLATALICTRNRGASVVPAVRSVLANKPANFEFLLVDQSTNDETAAAIEGFRNDARFRYIRSATTGIARARNLGLSHARSETVAITDDDCEVDEHWLAEIGAVFTRHPQVAVAYCNVAPVLDNPSLGFVPGYVATGSRLMTGMRHWCAPHGIGAGIAVRRSTIERIGGFDESLVAFEDSDLALRSLAMGRQVYHTHLTTIRHFGFRTWDEGRALTERDCLGIGAGYAKLLKCGYWRASLPCGYEFSTLVLIPTITSLLRLRKPPVLIRGVSLAKGFWRGIQMPVDRSRCLFRPAP